MRSARRHILLCVIASPLLVGCASDRPADQPSTVRDSAGIRIIESTSPTWGQNPRPHILPTPDETIGVTEGPAAERLFQVTAAVRLADGSITVLFGSTRSFADVSGVVRDTLDLGRYADDGTFLGTIGRVPGGEAFVEGGVGPFRLPFGHPGPTVAVQDAGIATRRGDGFEIGILSPQGEWIAVMRKAHEPRRITRTHVDRYQEA